jgi:LPXTG-motif cell wall-anchored protein
MALRQELSRAIAVNCYLRFRNRISDLARMTGLALCLLLSAGAFAAQITGTVSNGTTNKPSSGDEVVLLSLANGMSEVAKTKTDSQGHFTLNVPDEGAPHLVRVARQSVHYFKQAPPGATTADVTVYDAATQLEGVAADARVLHLQASAGSLEVSEMYVLKNESQPPRSRIGNQTFTVTLPDGAEMGEASTTGPSGMPVTATPVPSGVKNRYAFDFAIRPGETRFDVVYRMPYSGSYEFSLTPETRLNELGVLLPKSMKFTGISAGFAQDSDEAGLAVYFAKNLLPNQTVKFSITGEGLITGQSTGAAQPSSTGAATQTSSESNTASWIIIGATVLLIAGGGLLLWRKSAAKSPPAVPAGARTVARARAQAPAQPAQAAQGDMLDVLKDELFQLETDRLSGKITQEEYEKTKAGLDTLFRRQMKKR